MPLLLSIWRFWERASLHPPTALCYYLYRRVQAGRLNAQHIHIMSAHFNAVASSSKPHKEKKSKKDKSHKHKTTTNGVSEVDLNQNPSAKKSKHGTHAHGHKSKHGSKGPFQHQRSEMRLSLAPKYSGDQLVGVRDALDGLVMRWVFLLLFFECL